MSYRKEQVESLIKRTVAAVLQRGLGDPRTQGVLISVTKVEASSDLTNAAVFVSVMPQQHQTRALHALSDATMHVQHAVKKGVALRVVPHLRFKLDTQLKKESATLAAINEAMERTGPDDTDPAETPPANPE